MYKMLLAALIGFLPLCAFAAEKGNTTTTPQVSKREVVQGSIISKSHVVCGQVKRPGSVDVYRIASPTLEVLFGQETISRCLNLLAKESFKEAREVDGGKDTDRGAVGEMDSLICTIYIKSPTDVEYSISFYDVGKVTPEDMNNCFVSIALAKKGDKAWPKIPVRPGKLPKGYHAA